MSIHGNQRSRAWPLFLRTHAVVIEQLRSELMDMKGLPLTWFDVLIQLAHSDEGRLTMQGLADAVVLSKSGVTRLVDRMVEAGLLRREICATDRRVTYATLTARGEEALNEALPVHMEGVQRTFDAHLSQKEKQTLANAFTKILDAAAAHPGSRRAAG